MKPLDISLDEAVDLIIRNTLYRIYDTDYFNTFRTYFHPIYIGNRHLYPLDGDVPPEPQPNKHLYRLYKDSYVILSKYLYTYKTL